MARRAESGGLNPAVLGGVVIAGLVVYALYRRRAELEAVAEQGASQGARSFLDFVRRNPDESVRTATLAYDLGFRSSDFLAGMLR